MRSLVIGDLHLSDNPRDAYRLKFLQKLLPKIIKDRQPINWLVFAGDLTTAKDRHSAWLTNTITDSFVRLSDQTDIIINKGNHDYRDEDHPFFRFLSHIDRITWINRPRRICTDWMFLPHTYDYKAAWNTVDFEGIEMIIAHNTFEGAVSESGAKLPGIPLSALPNVPIIAGDIHKPQRHGNLRYVGAPYTINFGDDFKPRLLLVDGSKIISIPCPGPQKRLIEVKTGDILVGADYNPGDILKVRVHIEMKDVAKWQATRAAIRDWAEKHQLEVPIIQPMVTYNIERRKKTEVASERSDNEVLRSYGKHRGVDNKTLSTGITIVGEG
jgi:hypothetical protein